MVLIGITQRVFPQFICILSVSTHQETFHPRVLRCGMKINCNFKKILVLTVVNFDIFTRASRVQNGRVHMNQRVYHSVGFLTHPLIKVIMLLGGRAYCMGSVNRSDCWYLYTVSPGRPRYQPNLPRHNLPHSRLVQIWTSCSSV